MFNVLVVQTEFNAYLITLDSTLSAVGKEIKKLLSHWTEKQKEIEGQFKEFYIPQAAKKSRKAPKKTKQQENERLSSYAASLTIDFFKEVRKF